MLRATQGGLAPFGGKRILLGVHAEPVEIRIACAMIDGVVHLCISPDLTENSRKVEKSLDYLANQLLIELTMRYPGYAANAVQWLWCPDETAEPLRISLRWTGFRYHPPLHAASS